MADEPRSRRDPRTESDPPPANVSPSVSPTVSIATGGSASPPAAAKAASPSAAPSGRSSRTSIPGGPADAIKHYETLSSLHRQLAELETTLARERTERSADADRMAEMLVRLAEREKAAAAAEGRADEASARVATLEAELATAQSVAAALDEQLQATEEILAQFDADNATPLAGDVEARGADDKNDVTDIDEIDSDVFVAPSVATPDVADALKSAESRATTAERDRDALAREVEMLRASLDDMKSRTESMAEVLDGLRKVVQRASLPPPDPADEA